MNSLTTDYGIHPSEQLVHLFNEKPYQGADPEAAEVLIIGNDANYSPEISCHEFFDRILEYHADGVLFWRETGVHHPFLLREYPFDRRSGGVPYHNNFRKLGFTSGSAKHFSFVELLNMPTFGNTGSNRDLFFELLNVDHLNWLESLILGGDPKFVLINQTLARSVKRISKRLGALKKLAEHIAGEQPDAIAYQTSNTMIYNGYSFSASITDEYLERLSRLIRAFIKDGVPGHT